jgi:hypothetical protein
MTNIFRPMQMYTVLTQGIPTANLSSFQKSAYYAGFRIFYTLPSDLKSLMNEMAWLKLVLTPYLSTYSFYSVDEYLLSKK